MKQIYKRKQRPLKLMDAARFNWVMDTSTQLQKGLEELACQYQHLTHEEYMTSMLKLFKDAGLDLSCNDMRLLLALRRQTDQMLIQEKAQNC